MSCLREPVVEQIHSKSVLPIAELKGLRCVDPSPLKLLNRVLSGLAPKHFQDNRCKWEEDADQSWRFCLLLLLVVFVCLFVFHLLTFFLGDSSISVCS